MKNSLYRCGLVFTLIFFYPFEVLIAKTEIIRCSVNSAVLHNESEKIKYIRIGYIGKPVKAISETTLSLPMKANQLAPGLNANAEFKLGEIYVFPNPSKKETKPVIHIEVGIADSVQLKIYDIAGDVVQEAEITSAAQIIDDGQGPQYAYEYILDDNIPSGTYICFIQAHKEGKKDILANTKLAVIK